MFSIDTSKVQIPPPQLSNYSTKNNNNNNNEEEEEEEKRGELVGLVCGKSSLFSSPIRGHLFLVGSSGKHQFHYFPPHFPSQTK